MSRMEGIGHIKWVKHFLNLVLAVRHYSFAHLSFEMSSVQELKPAYVDNTAQRGVSDDSHGVLKKIYEVDSKTIDELSDVVQGGVKKMEVTTKTWSKWNLATAYLMYDPMLMLSCHVTDLNRQHMAHLLRHVNTRGCGSCHDSIRDEFLLPTFACSRYEYHEQYYRRSVKTTISKTSRYMGQTSRSRFDDGDMESWLRYDGRYVQKIPADNNHYAVVLVRP